MNVYVWERVEQCSRLYYSEGGVVVLAETEEQARELANAEFGCGIQPDETPDCWEGVTNGAFKVYIMPDTGRCR